MAAWLLFAAAAAALPACRAEQPDPDRNLPVPSAELPALTGQVVDTADLLEPVEERGLTALSSDLERRTGDQYVVVTTPSLRGRAIEDYGISLGRHWRIGQAERNNGILLIVAPAERKVRIEVGCGLERAMPDQDAHAIIQERLLPHFRRSDFPAGIRAGSEAIVGTLTTRAGIARGGDC